MRLAAIGYGRHGGAFFGGTAVDHWRSPQLGYSLGQAQDWYNRAKAALYQWDNLVAKIQTIASAGTRATIMAKYGIDNPAPNMGNECGYAAAVTRNNVADADQNGVDSGFPDHGPSRNRVEKLEGCVSDLATEVNSAVSTWGAQAPGAAAPGTPGAPKPAGAPGSAVPASAAGLPTVAWLGIGAAVIGAGILLFKK